MSGNKNEISFGDNARNIGLNIGENIDSVTAGKIEGSFNRVQEIKDDKPEVAKLLQKLSQQVAGMAEELSKQEDAETAEQVADDLESLTKEVARANPRSSQWKVSLAGLCDVAAKLSGFTDGVFSVAEKITGLLTGG